MWRGREREKTTEGENEKGRGRGRDGESEKGERSLVVLVTDFSEHNASNFLSLTMRRASEFFCAFH